MIRPLDAFSVVRQTVFFFNFCKITTRSLATCGVCSTAEPRHGVYVSMSDVNAKYAYRKSDALVEKLEAKLRELKEQGSTVSLTRAAADADGIIDSADRPLSGLSSNSTTLRPLRSVPKAKRVSGKDQSRPANDNPQVPAANRTISNLGTQSMLSSSASERRRAAELQEAFHRRETAMKEEILSLQKQLAELKLFKDMRASLLRELEDSRTTLRKTEAKHAKQVEDLQRQLTSTQRALIQAGGKKLKQDTPSVLASSNDSCGSAVFSQTAPITATSKSAKTRVAEAHSAAGVNRVVSKELEAVVDPAADGAITTIALLSDTTHMTNEQLTQELKIHQEASTILQQQNDVLRQQVKQLQLEVSLVQQKDEEFAKRGLRQTKQIRDMEAKNRSLERGLAQALRNAEVERAGWVSKHEQEVETARKEADTLRRTLTLQTQELKKIKALAQAIVEQRNDVERFFLEALDAVKTEIKTKRAEEYKQAKFEYQRQLRELALGSRLPTLNAGTGGDTMDSHAPLPPRGKVDLSDLGPEDRERVLRLLFAKIKAAHVAKSAASLSSPSAGVPVQPQMQVDTTAVDDGDWQEAGAIPTQPLTVSSAADATAEAAYVRGSTFVTEMNVEPTVQNQ